SASKDATPFGVYNLNFSDRYKPQAATVNQDVKKVTEGEIKAAGMFNSYINSIFRTDQPQIGGTSQALNYYIDRMNNKKSERAATRASAMIPVSVDFTTDGISGFSMGHAFLLPEQMLPNTYARFNQSQEKRVGFVVVGLDHSIQANNWDTSVKANMFFMKNADDFYSDKKYFNFNPLAQAEVDGVNNVNPTSANSPGGQTGGPVSTDTGCKTSYKSLPIKSTYQSNLLSYAEAAKYLKSKYPDISKAVFAILVAEAAKSGDNFRSAGGYNYAGVQTDCGVWGFSNFVAQFCRVDSGGKQRMFAEFPNNEAFLDFMANRIKSKGFTNDADQWTTTYINKW
ncbi:hypothetical protein EBR43_14415, partial [bacterium]|nr:hypothetical protein [bacterium]